MQLYNNLSRRLELFEPIGDSVSVYVCGITPYDTTHVGHAFTYAAYDILIRYLEYLGYRVLYAQNVTDIDDDILRRAKKVDQEWRTLGNRWTVHFIEDNKSLNILAPNYFPKATDVIEEIQNAVQELISAGVAYQVGGNVYFHIADDPEYGKLSRLSKQEMLPVANERGNFPDDPDKRDPLDFVLWQARAPGEPAWNSPWGPGRPGWHIECSTMSSKYLGTPIDIHGGGADLLFPHHESEIAQAECGTGRRPFTRFWLHSAMVSYQGDKMSKSLGNLVMVRDLLQDGWPADALRLYMATHRYSEEWVYDESKLATSAAKVRRLRDAVTIAGGSGTSLDAQSYEAGFRAAMDDDLDSPSALNILVNLANEILSAAAAGQNVADAQNNLRKFSSILGLRLDHLGPEHRVISGWDHHRPRFVDGAKS